MQGETEREREKIYDYHGRDDTPQVVVSHLYGQFNAEASLQAC